MFSSVRGTVSKTCYRYRRVLTETLEAYVLTVTTVMTSPAIMTALINVGDVRGTVQL